MTDDAIENAWFRISQGLDPSERSFDSFIAGYRAAQQADGDPKLLTLVEAAKRWHGEANSKTRSALLAAIERYLGNPHGGSDV